MVLLKALDREWSIRFQYGAPVTICTVLEVIHTTPSTAISPGGYVGYARCHRRDTFTKKIGRELALERALAKSPEALQHSLQRAWEAHTSSQKKLSQVPTGV